MYKKENQLIVWIVKISVEIRATNKLIKVEDMFVRMGIADA